MPPSEQGPTAIQTYPIEKTTIVVEKFNKATVALSVVAVLGIGAALERYWSNRGNDADSTLLAAPTVAVPTPTSFATRLAEQGIQIVDLQATQAAHETADANGFAILQAAAATQGAGIIGLATELADNTASDKAHATEDASRFGTQEAINAANATAIATLEITETPIPTDTPQPATTTPFPTTTLFPTEEPTATSTPEPTQEPTAAPTKTPIPTATTTGTPTPTGTAIPPDNRYQTAVANEAATRAAADADIKATEVAENATAAALPLQPTEGPTTTPLVIPTQVDYAPTIEALNDHIGTAESIAATALVEPEIPPTSTPTPTAISTFTPKPTNTPSATFTPTPTETAVPTSTHMATATLVPTRTQTPEPTFTNTPIPTRTQSPTPTATATESPTATETLPTEAPSATEIPTIKGKTFVLTNVPDVVSVDQVNTAKDFFVNTLGFGSEMALAEPGGLFLPSGQQQVFETNEDSSQSLPEGGWVFASGAKMTIQIGDATIRLKEKDGNVWFLFVRGPYTNGDQTMVFSDFDAGNIEVEAISPSDENGIAFWSEGQFFQKTESALNDSPNCGDAGCSKVSVIFYDSNTKSFVILTKTDNNEDITQGWNFVASNWYKEEEN